MKNWTLKALLCVSVFVVISCAEKKTVTINEVRKVKWQSVEIYSNSENQYQFSGKVEAAKDVNLSFRVAGVIEDFAGKNGTFVKKGEVIVVMDDRDYVQQLNATQAEYDAISGEVSRVVALYQDSSVSENDYNKAVNGLKQITAKLTVHRNSVNDTKLIAPFDGYIQKQFFSAGETVNAGMPVVSFLSAGAPEIIVNIPFRNYSQQDDFLSATASVAQFPDEVFDLQWIGVSPKANLNQLHKTRFAVETKNSKKLAPGMTATVTLNYKGDSTNLYIIPFSSIIEKNQIATVFVVTDDHVLESRQVHVKEIRRDGNVLVFGGVAQGEKVVTAGINYIKERQKVELLPEKTTTNVGGML